MYHILEATLPYEGNVTGFVTTKATRKEAKEQFRNFIIGHGFEVSSVLTLGTARKLNHKALNEHKTYQSAELTDDRQIPFKHPLYCTWY